MDMHDAAGGAGARFYDKEAGDLALVHDRDRLFGQGAGGKSSYVVGLTLSMAAGIQYGKAAPIGGNLEPTQQQSSGTRAHSALTRRSSPLAATSGSPVP